MSEITEKVAYLRGLADGLGIGQDTPVEKVLAQVLETMELMAEQMEMLESAQDETLGYVETVDENVSDLEDIIFGDDDDDFDDFDDWEGCEGCAMPQDDEDSSDEE